MLIKNFIQTLNYYYKDMYVKIKMTEIELDLGFV